MPGSSLVLVSVMVGICSAQGVTLLGSVAIVGVGVSLWVWAQDPPPSCLEFSILLAAFG